MKYVFLFLLAGALIMVDRCESMNLTIQHKKINLDSIRDRLLNKTEPTAIPVDAELKILDELAEFELGQSLLQNQALSGYWTAYLILYGPQKKNLSPLERWMIHKAPAVLATRERFNIFQSKLQKHVKPGIVLASLPCGTMEDLLRLDFTNAPNAQLVGIDIDNESIEHAKKNAKDRGLDGQTKFLNKDAWGLELEEVFDLLTSNGLNIYEPDNKKVIALYKQFYKALKPGGILVTSFLTPPPSLSQESTWQNVNPEDALKQRAIFSDIIQVNWQSFRTESETRQQLTEAGFKDIEITYDSQGMFPTVVARKQES